MWQMMAVQALGSGISAMMTEKSNKQLAGIQKKNFARREANLRDNENLQLQAIAENFTYEMEANARRYTEGMSALNREVRSKKAGINFATVQRGVTTEESSFAEDMKNELNSQYNEAVVVSGAVQRENIDRLSKMNLDNRLNLIRETTATIIEGRYNLANSLSSIAQSTQNAYSQAGLSMLSAGASIGMNTLSQHSAGAGAGGGGTLDPNNSLKLSGTPDMGFNPSSSLYQGMKLNTGGNFSWT